MTLRRAGRNHDYPIFTDVSRCLPTIESVASLSLSHYVKEGHSVHVTKSRAFPMFTEESSESGALDREASLDAN